MEIKMIPLVSIIMPTFNRFEFLLEAIKGYLSQDFTNFELIIISDGDFYLNDLVNNSSFPIKDDRIKFILLEKNSQSVSIPRNIGISHSKGKFICPADDDVIVSKNKLNNAIHILESNTESTLVYGTQLRENINFLGNFDLIYLKNFNPLNGWGVDTNQIVYRKSIYSCIPLTFFKRACDWNLMKLIWEKFPNSFISSEVVYSFYKWHGKNRSLDESTKYKNIYPIEYKDYFTNDLLIDWEVK